MKSWIEISAGRLAANYRTAARLTRELASADTGLLAVIKADAYGHGATLCAPVLAHAGAPWLGVTNAEEGIAVTDALLTANIPPVDHPRILIMCGALPEDAEAIVQHRLTPVVWNREQLGWLADAVNGSEPLRVHLEIDSGMSRQGVTPGDALRKLCVDLAAEKRLRVEGILTHFASAEQSDPAQTLAQRAAFEQAIAETTAAGLKPAWIHAGNTSGIDNGLPGQAATMHWLGSLAHRAGARPMARAGLALYGGAPPLDPPDAARLRPALAPVMTWKTRIMALHEVAAGARIGYNGTLRTERPTRVALLPIGYADGLRRELSNPSPASTTGGWVILHGERAPILGRISMNLTTVDVTEIPTAAPGDEITVLGEGITADDHAALAHTISYEILCGMRAPRLLV